MDWFRVSLGFVSAYVLVRNGEVAIVDTGVDGSEGAIEAVLSAAGVAWSDVGHVILTHKHHDHIGSLGAVASRAPEATAYAGERDIPAIDGRVTPVADGDEIFGLEIVATPGHTPGHICVLDRGRGLLLAGDALRSADGEVIAPNPRFTEDMDTAIESVRKLAGYDYGTALFGHGDPVETEAAIRVAGLAERL